MTGSSSALTSLVDRMIECVLTEEKVRVFWLEGADRQALRRPYEEFDLHLAAEDPHFQDLVDSHGDWLACSADLEGHQDEPTDYEGVHCRLRLSSGEQADLWLERMSLLGKRSRVRVLPLVDRTGQFRQVLDITQPA